jgi:uncharacterized protein (TIGR02996 family)
MPLAPKAAERVRREFFPEDYAAAVKALANWRTKNCAPGERPSRLHAAVLNLAQGNVRHLKSAIAAGRLDFRDLLLSGEYAESKRFWAVLCPAEKTPVSAEEESLLQTIADDPPNNGTRLVYADWLEDRGDRRADYVRVLCRWLACRPAVDAKLIAEERRLRDGLSRRWLARVRGMAVRGRRRK